MNDRREVLKKFDVERLINIALLGLRDYRAITDNIVYALVNTSDMCRFPIADDTSRSINQGSFGVVETRYMKGELVVSANLSGGRFEKVTCVFKTNKKAVSASGDMQVGEVTVPHEMGGGGSVATVLYLPDPIMEIVMNCLSTHIYDSGRFMGMSRLLGAFLCREKGRITSVIQKSVTSLYGALETNWANICTNELVFRGCLVQIVYSLYLLRVSYGFTHLDLHFGNVLLDTIEGYGKARQYNGVELKGHKYVLYNTNNDSVDERGVRVPRMLAVPIANGGIIARISDYGAGIMMTGRGDSSYTSKSNAVISTNARVLAMLKGGLEAYRNCIRSTSYSNTCDLRFFLLDTFKAMSQYGNKTVSSIVTQWLDNYYYVIFNRRIGDDLPASERNDPNVMTRHVGIDKGFESSAYMLNAVYALCEGNVKSKLVPFNFPRSRTLAGVDRVQVYYAPPYYSNDRGGSALNENNSILCETSAAFSNDADRSVLRTGVEHETGRAPTTAAEGLVHDSTRIPPTPLYGLDEYTTDAGIRVSVYAFNRPTVTFTKGSVYSDGTLVPESLYGTPIPFIKMTELRFPKKYERIGYSLSTLNKSVDSSTLIRVSVGNYSKDKAKLGQSLACFGDAVSSLYQKKSADGVKRVKYPAWAFPFTGAIVIPKLRGDTLKFGELTAIASSVKRAEAAMPCCPVLKSRKGDVNLVSLMSDWNWSGVRTQNDPIQPYITDAGVIPNNMLTSHAIILDDGMYTSIIYVHGPRDGVLGVSRFNLLEILDMKDNVKCAMCLSSGPYSTLEYRDAGNRIAVTNTIPAHVPDIRTLNVSSIE
ncbi:90 kDa Serine/threonine protein kinase [Spodoptera frugiperda ascovirus 1a]|uniref:90 kDa Serine/threonine protein kinase n=1 Tax=Spodoptera frugiperda ascovirus 1a TaxID=113370 RepID=Q0E537_SFAVA|nr:90 kDa Serine/threonine protein kinase [Spodoptera frugiperda ascovirus 1a]CAL44664.1 90 kDa Serine/threonine protein kinase [Spodoptera frugiperda ascovirus 1a]